MRRGLYWFQHDLRLADNLALKRISEAVDQLICVFIIDPRWFKAGHYQSRHLGKFRQQFLIESLQDLDTQLAEWGQTLQVVQGLPVSELTKIQQTYGIEVIAASFHPGVYERQQWQRLKDNAPNVEFIQAHTTSLFDPSELPFELSALPDSFTPFRKRIEQACIQTVETELNRVPPHPPIEMTHVLPLHKANLSTDFIGGTTAGLKQLQHFLFESQAVKTYKLTRNAFSGWDNSSKLSPWLANGSLSPRQIYRQLIQFEKRHEANESTYWLFFELLWREYFHWYLTKYQHKLFRFRGVQNKKLLTTFNPQRFAKWCQGDTPYPIVNACMRQLNATGFMSNRGRQLVASCLVHELQLDWRYGAAYFEQQLIDFDVASNWANWQYLAGVGADPRGHRHFDLAKQASQYDPDGSFVNSWQAKPSSAPLDSTDAADWPIG